MTEIKLEQRVHWLNSLDNTWKNNAVSSIPESLTFVTELAQEIPAVLAKIEEKYKDEIEQKQALGARTKGEESNWKQHKMKLGHE